MQGILQDHIGWMKNYRQSVLSVDSHMIEDLIKRFNVMKMEVHRRS